MNIIDLQDNLKNLPENALMKEMQQPTGSAPPFLILGELKRRKQMRDDYSRQQNSDMKTVAEETVTAAGMPQEGIMQASRALTPKTNMAQNTGVAEAMPVQPTQAPQPQAPQMMSGGGIMRYAPGGAISDVSRNIEDFAATPSYERGTGRATMIDGTLVEVMPDGSVFNARTSDIITGELAQAAIAKLTPDLTADNAAFAASQEVPSAYRPEVGMPTQADLNLKAGETTQDVFPNDISVFDTDATYNAEQAQRQAEAARMAGINEIPTEDPTFTGDVLPYLGRVASAAGSRIVEATAPEVLPVGSVPTPKIQTEIASLNAKIAAAGDDEVLIDLLNRRKNGLIRQLQVAEAQIDTGEFLTSIPTTIKRGFNKYIASGLGFKTPEEAADSINAIDASSADATALERAREAKIKALEDGATTVPNVIEQESSFPVNTGEPVTVPSAEEGGIGSLLPPKTVATAPADQAAGVASTSRGGRGGGGGGGGGGAGFGSMDSRIAQMLSSRQKAAESDKWMALAQTGMALMASKNPTLGGALGEAGLAGVGALQKSKQGAQDFETDMMKLQLQLDIAQQRARSSGARAKSIPATALTNAYTMVTDAQERLNNAQSSAEKLSASRALEAAQGRFLQIQTRFDSQYGVPTAAGSGRKQV